MPTPQNWPVFAPPQWPAFTPPLTLSIKVQPKRSTSDDSKTASRDPAAVRAPHPDIWRLWLSPMPSPGSYRAEVSRLFRRARKLQIRSDLRPTPWLTRQSTANQSPGGISLHGPLPTHGFVERGKEQGRGFAADPGDGEQNPGDETCAGGAIGDLADDNDARQTERARRFAQRSRLKFALQPGKLIRS